MNAARVVVIPAVAAPVITIVSALRTVWPLAQAQVSPITTVVRVVHSRVWSAGVVAVTVAAVVYNAPELQAVLPPNPRASSARSESISTNPTLCSSDSATEIALVTNVRFKAYDSEFFFCKSSYLYTQGNYLYNSNRFQYTSDL